MTCLFRLSRPMICGRLACGSGSSQSRTWCTCGTRRPHRCARIRAASSTGCSRLRQTRTGMGRTMRRGRTWTPERRGSYYTAVVTIFTRVAFRTPPGLRALQRKTEIFCQIFFSSRRLGSCSFFSLSPSRRVSTPGAGRPQNENLTPPLVSADSALRSDQCHCQRISGY